MKILSKKILFCFFFPVFVVFAFAQNPFLRPGSDRPKPVIQRPTPPPPPPKPQNTNLELRGFFKFQGKWYFSIYDKAKNKGVWLQKGESFDDGKVEIEAFNEETEVVKLKGGFTLSLKKSDNKVLSVPSSMPVTKKPAPPNNNAKPNIKSTATNAPRKVVTSGGRTITIPPRNPAPQQKK